MDWLTQPIVVAAFVSALTVLVTKFFDARLAKKKQNTELDVSGRELLSKDEQTFRKNIIEQLQSCHENNIRLSHENVQLQRMNIDLESKVSVLTTEIAHMKIAMQRQGIV